MKDDEDYADDDDDADDDVDDDDGWGNNSNKTLFVEMFPYLFKGWFLFT